MRVVNPFSGLTFRSQKIIPGRLAVPTAGVSQRSERDMGSSNSGDRIAAMAAQMAPIQIANVRGHWVRLSGFRKA